MLEGGPEAHLQILVVSALAISSTYHWMLACLLLEYKVIASCGLYQMNTLYIGTKRYLVKSGVCRTVWELFKVSSRGLGALVFLEVLTALLRLEA